VLPGLARNSLIPSPVSLCGLNVKERRDFIRVGVHEAKFDVLSRDVEGSTEKLGIIATGTSQQRTMARAR